MTDQKKTKKTKSVVRGRPPTSTSIYTLAPYYEKQLAELDRQQAAIEEARRELQARIPPAVKEVIKLNAKFKSSAADTDEPPAEEPIASPPPALTTEPSKPKLNGKSNGRAEVAQA